MDERVGGSGNVAGAGAVCAAAPVVVRDLVKTYGAIKAVDHISFKLEPATTVALLGGNGAGKTTTIAMLLGLVMPTSGEVRVFGADMARDRGSVAHRMNFQSPYVDLPMRLTVRENLTVYAGLYGVANKIERIAYIADDLQIEALLDRPTGKLSAGQKTRVGLAKALLNAPELLLLDEPTASLDPDTADWIRKKLKTYAERRRATLLIASHNMAEVERLADRVILLDAGRIIEDGTPKALIETYGRETLEDVFLDVVRGRRQGAQRDADDGASGTERSPPPLRGRVREGGSDSASLDPPPCSPESGEQTSPLRGEVKSASRKVS